MTWKDPENTGWSVRAQNVKRFGHDKYKPMICKNCKEEFPTRDLLGTIYIMLNTFFCIFKILHIVLPFFDPFPLTLFGTGFERKKKKLQAEQSIKKLTIYISQLSQIGHRQSE